VCGVERGVKGSGLECEGCGKEDDSLGIDGLR